MFYLCKGCSHIFTFEDLCIQDFWYWTVLFKIYKTNVKEKVEEALSLRNVHKMKN